jgi:hypothetical protein
MVVEALALRLKDADDMLEACRRGVEAVRRPPESLQPPVRKAGRRSNRAASAGWCSDRAFAVDARPGVHDSAAWRGTWATTAASL